MQATRARFLRLRNMANLRSGRANAYFYNFLCTGTRGRPGARSIRPKFPEISVQNSMDRFGPTGKVSKKLVHLLRWSSLPGRTGWNFGWMDRAPEKSRRWSLEKPPWICSLKNASVAYILGSLSNQDDDGDKNVTNLHIWQWKTAVLHALHVQFSFLDISQTFLFSLRREMTCFAVVWTTWAYDDKCSTLSAYLWSAGSNLIPGKLEHILQAQWLRIIEK